MRIAFYTLGCKVNQYDTQMMREKLLQRGHECISFDQPADCYVINTCTVTNISDKKSRQIISKCKKFNPEAMIVVCGCYAQISPEQCGQIDGIDIVIGTANRKYVADYIDEYLQKHKQIICVADLESEKRLCNEYISDFEEKTRAIVKIEDGCRNFCSYCAIPFARGKIRSKLPTDIEKELSALYRNGFREVVLTGIHLASYGTDLQNVSLCDVITMAAQIGFRRIRLGSLEPNIIQQDFLDKISKVPQLMPSFHLSLQSGCDSVLRRMNRHYTTQTYRDAVSLLRQYFPDCAVTTDIIVGFPGESNEEFDQTLAFADGIAFAKIHIFPYSPRLGTKAATMPDQIDGTVKSARCKALEAIEQKHRIAFFEKHIGLTCLVLFEQIKDGQWEGYTENYLPVRIKTEQNLSGILTPVKIIDTDGHTLFSQL